MVKSNFMWVKSFSVRDKFILYVITDMISLFPADIRMIYEFG